MATTKRVPKASRRQVRRRHFDQGEAISLSLPHHLQPDTPRETAHAYGHSLEDRWEDQADPTLHQSMSRVQPGELLEESDIPQEILEASTEVHRIPGPQSRAHSVPSPEPEEVVPVVEVEAPSEAQSAFVDDDFKAAFAEDLSAILSRDVAEEAEEVEVIEETPEQETEAPATGVRVLDKKTPDSIAISTSPAHQQFDRGTDSGGTPQTSLANQLSYFDQLLDKEEARQETLPAVIPPAASALSLEQSFTEEVSFSQFPLKFHPELFPNATTV